MKFHLVAGSLIALIAVVASLFLQARKAEKPDHIPRETTVRSRQHSVQTPQDLAARDLSQDRIIRNDWNSLLSWLDGQPPPTPDEIRNRLRELRLNWAQMDPHVLAAVLDSLLKSCPDRSTGLPFTVGPQGFLSGWPDLRTFLVDTLAIADPEESAKTARQILRETDSSSEFVVAIRALLRGGDSDAKPDELLSCLHTLLGRESWQNDPATMESLDLARHLGNRDAANALLNWNGNPKAREMALHEFAAEHPSIVVSILAERQEPLTTQQAALLARADPSDPAQAKAIDDYLRNPDIPLDHRESFLTLYPLRSLTTGYRLYHGNPTPYDQESIRRSDAAALQQADAWLADSSLQPLHNSLAQWKKRLLHWQKSDP